MISAVVSARLAGLDRIKSGFTSRFANRLPIFGASRLPRSPNGRSLSGNAVSSQLDFAWRMRNSVFMPHPVRRGETRKKPLEINPLSRRAKNQLQNWGVMCPASYHNTAQLPPSDSRMFCLEIPLDLGVGEYGDVYFGLLPKTRKHLNGPPLSTRAS